ncbi:MAG: TlpA family protein disulfide reductase, partial [Methylobacillus glycogenes]|nr:TlpA family protein disulfide reductase [Methylobacillus glycogenes]
MRKLQNKWHFALLALGIMLLISLIQLIQRNSSEAVLATPVQVHASTEAFFAANVQDIAGKTQTLSQWRGKLLVINFWATWCAPCREEMPELDALQKAHADQLT